MNSGSRTQDRPEAFKGAGFGPPLACFEKCDWISFGLASFLSLAVYLCSLSSEVGLEESGTLVTGAYYAGVPRPPGHPLWTLYAWLFATLVPFSNVAWRVALSSAVAASLACGLIAMIVSSGGEMLFGGTGPLSRHSPQVKMQLRVLAGVVAGTVFGLSGSVWRQAVIVETGALGLLLFAAVLWLLALWTYEPRLRGRLYWAWFVYGLAFATNQGFAVAALGLGLLVLFIEPPLGRDTLLVSAAAALAALLGQGLVLTRRPSGWLPTLRWTGMDGIWRGVFAAALVAAIAAGAGIWRTRGVLTYWKAVLASGSACLLGLSSYHFEPLASMSNPPLNWAYPRTVEGFFHLIGRGQYERLEPVSSIADFSAQVDHFAVAVIGDFGLLALLIAFVPFGWFRQGGALYRRWMLSLTALFLCLSLFLLAMQSPLPSDVRLEAIKPYFSLSYLVLALWTGYGVLLLGAKLAKPDPSP